MTVTSSINKIKATGNDVTTQFPVPFKVVDETDLKVYKVTIATEVAVLQTLNVDYTVAINPTTEEATVIYAVAPTSLEQSFIIRVLPLTQETDIPTESNLPEKQLENAYDKITMISQQLEERTSRSIILPESSDLSNLVLPLPQARRALLWNATKDGFINSDLDPDQAVNDSQANADAAAASAAAASASETNAATSETNANTSETNASVSETNAAASAAAALVSENNAATSETNVGVSETNAAASAAAALTSENNAATSETNAATSASNASTSASNAATSETNAATSASNASTSETNAATSASNAATSETNAGISETNAAASAAAAAAEVGNFENAPVLIKTGNYVILPADLGSILVMNSSSPFSFILPTIATGSEILMIKNIGSGALGIRTNQIGTEIEKQVLAQFESIILFADLANNTWRALTANIAAQGLIQNSEGVGINISQPAGIEIKGEAILYAGFNHGTAAVDLSPTFARGGLNASGLNLPDPTIVAGGLDLRGGTEKYVNYDAKKNASSAIQFGAVRFQYTPNYTGAPAGIRSLFSIIGTNNSIILTHNTSQQVAIQINDNVGASIINSNFGVWSQTNGQQYEIELNWDLTSGATRLFIDGVQQGSTLTDTGTRDENVDDIYIGGDNPDGLIDEFLIFDTVQHTKNYTAPSTVFSPTGQLQAKVDDTTIEIKANGELGVKEALGKVIQFVETASSAVVSGTTTIPYDATIPQQTEGVEFLTREITPISATSKLCIEIDVCWGGTADQETYTFALFQDAITDAIFACADRPRFTVVAGSDDIMFQKSFRFSVNSASTTSRTYKLRVGAAAAGTFYMNRAGDVVPYGGVAQSFMRVYEIAQ